MSDAPTTRGVFLTVTEGGRIITRTPALPDGPGQYEQLHALVGGYLEIFTHLPTDKPRRSLQFICDEDGLSKGLPVNLYLHGRTIVGPVLIVAAEPPVMHGLDDGEADAVSHYVRMWTTFGGR